MPKKRAFTLMEMLITIAILAVLASLMLPSMISMVEKSRGTEAKDILYKFYVGYQRLVDEEGGVPNPFNYTRAGMGTNPNTSVGANFNYEVRANQNNWFRVRAVRNGNASAWIQINLTTGCITGVQPYV